MKKVLIYHNVANIKPVGGSSGYLYNLGIENNEKIENIKFTYIDRKIFSKDNLKKQYNKLPNIIKNIYRIIVRTKEYYLINRGVNLSFHLKEFDAIHFHNCFELYSCRKQLDTYKGKIILTIHSPKPPFLEVKEDSFTYFERCFFQKRIDNYEKMTEFAFNRANCIIFPSVYAEESYYKLWNKYSNIKSKNKEKYQYLYTGAKPCFVKTSRKDIRDKYGIPQDAFVISFVGRHNKVKGYDRLKKILTLLWKKENGIYCLNAGNEGPIYALKDIRWKEVGWTNDPYSIVNAADLFILPNRETYFDLVLLEILSLGQIVLASNTGGNKEFVNNKGVLLFNTDEEAMEKIEKISKMSQQERNEMRNANSLLFAEKFTNVIFRKAYVDLIKKVLS